MLRLFMKESRKTRNLGLSSVQPSTDDMHLQIYRQRNAYCLYLDTVGSRNRTNPLAAFYDRVIHRDKPQDGRSDFLFAQDSRWGFDYFET